MVLDFNTKVRTNLFSAYKNTAFYSSKSTDNVVEFTARQDTFAKLEADIAKLETMSKELAQSQQKYEQQILQSKIEYGVQDLEQIAERINSLAAQLEAEMRHFKDIAVEVNQCYHHYQRIESNIDTTETTSKSTSKSHRWVPLNIWDIHFSSIPSIVKRGSKFIIVEKIVNLFK